MSAAVLARHEPVMGTVVSLRIDHDDGDTGGLEAAVEEAVAELHRLDRIFSTWKPESPLSRWRRGELPLEELPPEVPEVLARCAEAKMTTAGYFDPWAMAGGVDPTGLVKGWAIERAASLLPRDEVLGTLVNGGGDIAASGSEEGRHPWRVGIRHPWRPEALACVVELAGGRAIATSGRYERGEHLIDPHAAATGQPRGALVVSASVVGPSLAMADAYATALAVAGEDERPLGGVLAAGYEVYRIFEQGREEASDGFPFLAEGTTPAGARHR